MSHPPRPARYRVIADELAAEIRAGKYPIGTNLPVENDLAVRFETSRQTMREALRILGDRGLIVRRAGFGTTVINSGARALFTLSVGNLSQLLSYPPGVRRRHLGSGPYVADEETAKMLGCSVGAEWIRIRAVRTAEEDSLPLCWVDIFIAPRFAAIARQRGAERIPVVEQIENTFGEKVASAEVDFAVGRVTKEMSSALRARVNEPALTIVRRYLGARGEPLEITVSTHPEDRYTHRMKLAKSPRS
ncbi:MAG TPA: GntR family transcriptional regulator [Ramlibacter sp.]|uniref:GntR family transcriptional regulator n=1 Tax=Ramlibacter sp. TaxID=1917967 RepID=UPI002B5D4BF5|nr:GntR family transcriptional regulator [Ramlibacter sp.]HVZ44889.1 GntR family transcriptional regulator [Ramlibacter sp.]